MTELVIATTNRGKLAELRQLLEGRGVKVMGLCDIGGVPEAAETGKNFSENARQKAVFYGTLLGGWILADDSGLEVDALGGAPGVHSARFAGGDGADGASRDRANNAKLLGLLAEVPPEKRTARFRCSLCLCYGGEVVLEVEGQVEGRILSEPRGENGFGYDPLFLISAAGKTAAELGNGEKNALSHRGMALRALLEKLEPFVSQSQMR